MTQRYGKRAVLGLIALAVLLLGFSWLMSSPTPSGSDEPAAYIRALAVAQGELTGPHALFPYRDQQHPEAVYIWDQTSRSYQVPALQAPAATFACDAGGITTPATCTAGTRCERWSAPCTGSPPTTGAATLVTYLGDYEPTTYVVPGLLALLADSDVNGLRAARFGTVLIACLFITLAAALLWDRRRPGDALLGLVISVTPMVIYTNSVLNASGGEIASSICFSAGLIRITRDEGKVPRWIWIITGLSGAFLGFSRAFGPLWIVIAFLTIVAYMGFRRAWHALRAGRGYAVACVGLAVAGLVTDLVWWELVGRPKGGLPLSDALSVVRGIADSVPLIYQQQIGGFGWGEGDVTMGSFAYIVWGVMAIGLVLLSLLAGTLRQRFTLIGSIIANYVFIVIAGAIISVEFGFGGTGIVGRYILPWTVIITLLAGETFRANRDRLGRAAPRHLILYAGLAAALCQGIGIYMAARRFAVGTTGALLFLGKSQWSPPLGWVPWLGIGAAGCVALAAAAVVAHRSQLATERFTPNVHAAVS
ncbi:MAG: DUF2142 domain-containing protein [Candidatus Dormibacteraeota bacterium]|nr:DUF2142 domain-containing protein [Candidatus Dormibacteraeota bacterium]